MGMGNKFQESVMKKYGKCQIVGCPKEAEWGQYKRVWLEKKVFIYVCDECEKEIGDENEAHQPQQAN